MKRQDIWRDIEFELANSRRVDPSWPDHVVAQAAKVSAESGELLNIAIDKKYKKQAAVAVIINNKEQLRSKAIDVIVSAIRFIENIPDDIKPEMKENEPV